MLEKKLAKESDGEHKRGVLKSSVGELRAKIERSQIASCRIESKRFGFSPLTIETADGTVYELEVAMAHKGKAQKVVEALGAQARRRRSQIRRRTVPTPAGDQVDQSASSFAWASVALGSSQAGNTCLSFSR